MARKSTQSADKETEKKNTTLPDNAAAQEAPLVDAEHRSRCGGAMRTARERLGLTTQEIANRLRLSAKQIEALEADNFAALPESTIVRGFIRNYAKQLKIDAEPLLDAYNVLAPSRAPQSFSLQPNEDVKVNEYRKPNALRYVLFGLLAVLGLGIWLFYQNFVQKPSPIAPTAEQIQSNQLEPLPEVALPAAERATDEAATQLVLPGAESSATVPQAPAQDTTPLPEAATNSAVTTPVVPAAPLAPQPPVVQRPLAAAEPSQSPTTAGMTKLEFTASQETWISVTDASGREIYSKTLFEGNRDVVEAKPPANITVGNSLGTTLSVNGKSVDLAPHTRVNVAHIKVN